MRKLGLTLLAVALSAPFTFAKAQASSSSQAPTTKAAKHKVKHHKKHGAKTNKNAQSLVK